MGIFYPVLTYGFRMPMVNKIKKNDWSPTKMIWNLLCFDLTIASFLRRVKGGNTVNILQLFGDIISFIE